MTIRLFLGRALLMPLVAAMGTAACGSSPQPSQTCSNAPPPPAAVPVNSAQDAATNGELAKYDVLIGRYLRGDVTVYRGTVSGQATVAVNDSAPVYQVQQSLPDEPALALLDIRATNGGDWFPPRENVPAASSTAALVVQGLPSHLYISYAQVTEDPGVTWAGAIQSSQPPTDNLLETSCSACASSLWEQPSAIAFAGLVTNGTVDVYNSDGTTSVPVSTTSSVTLTAVSPCQVVWQDLAVLNTVTGPNEFSSGFEDFQPEGGLMVAHDIGQYLPVPPSRGQCALATNYSVDLWVDPSDLSNHGVRNFMITSMSSVCPT
jgi:hypothetical protein